jgi:hypothetical protein
MAYFAKVNQGLVEQVIVAEAEFFDTFIDVSPGEWVESSNEGSFRKNPASIGFAYDEDRDAFIPPKPYISWLLNEDTCLWESPIGGAPITLDPEGNQEVFFMWNEEAQIWDEATTNWKEIN